MKMNQSSKSENGLEQVACARCWNLPVSLKHSLEISNFLRYKNTVLAKKLLEEVIAEKRAVPFRRFFHNVGHKPGMASGRFPQKAAREFLKLVKSVEANAQVKNMDTSNLKISKIISNRAAIPMTGSRWQRATKRTNLEIEVQEFKSKESKTVKNNLDSKTKNAERSRP